MSQATNHQIKINRARTLSDVGNYPSTCYALMAHLPAALIARATAAELAMCLDAIWSASCAAKAIAECDAVDEGAIWDERQQRLREISQ